MNETFTKRMRGGHVSDAQVRVLERFVDAIPALPPRVGLERARIEDGRVLFVSKGCATCHAGARLTSNASTDVGSGGVFQIPPLVNVGYRAPFMHDGCAQTLLDRFSERCDAKTHGSFDLTTQEQRDVVEYLESL